MLSYDYTFFGTTATYTPAGGSGSTVTIILDEDFDAKKSEFESVRADAEISVRQSQVSSRPGYRDTFTTTDGAGTSQTWYIVRDGVRENRELSDFGGEWVCKVIRDEKAMPIRGR